MKLGFIVDSEYLPPDLEAVLHESKKSRNFSVDLVITYASPNKNNLLISLFKRFFDLGFFKFIHTYLFRLLLLYESRTIKITSKKNKSSLLRIDSLGIPVFRVRPIFSPSKLVVRFKDEDLDVIKSKNLDVLIRGGHHIIRGRILDLCPFGILGMHHGDNHKYRGMPSAFWEVYCKEKETGFIIQKLRKELDSGNVFYKGFIDTKSTVYENTHFLHERARIEFPKFLNELSKTGSLPDEIPPNEDKVPLTTTPNLRELLKYIYKVHVRRDKI